MVALLRFLISHLREPLFPQGKKTKPRNPHITGRITQLSQYQQRESLCCVGDKCLQGSLPSKMGCLITVLGGS